MVDLELFVTGRNTGFVGNDPHLDEVHRVAVLVGMGTGDTAQTPRVVLLGVQDAGARAHPLSQARVDDPGMPHRILMNQRTLQHPGDDLHVLMRVGVETHPRNDDVIVVDHQHPVVGIGGVVVAAEREGMLGIEPACVGLEAVVGPADIQRGRVTAVVMIGAPFEMWEWWLRALDQRTCDPYISPSGSAMSSRRAPSGSRKYRETSLCSISSMPASVSLRRRCSHRSGSTLIAT